MAIVGIDQSLSGTGVAILNDDGELQKTIIIEPPKKLGIGTKRLDYISATVVEILRCLDERFVIAREGYSFGSKGRATFSLGELGGAIDLSIFRLAIENFVTYSVIPPGSWKKYCFGIGSVKKDTNYLLQVYKKVGMEFPDDNQADAYMIARTLWAMCMVKRSQEFFENMTIIQKEALVPLKTEGVTKATLKKFSYEEYCEKLILAMGSIQVFNQELANTRQVTLRLK